MLLFLGLMLMLIASGSFGGADWFSYVLLSALFILSLFMLIHKIQGKTDDIIPAMLEGVLMVLWAAVRSVQCLLYFSSEETEWEEIGVPVIAFAAMFVIGFWRIQKTVRAIRTRTTK